MNKIPKELSNLNVSKRISLAKKKELPVNVLEQLSYDSNFRVRLELTKNHNLNSKTINKLISDENAEVRASCALYQKLNTTHIEKISQDKDENVVVNLINSKNLNLQQIKKLVPNSTDKVKLAICKNDLTTSDILDDICSINNQHCLLAIASHANTNLSTLKELLKLDKISIFLRLAENPSCSEGMLLEILEKHDEKDIILRIISNPSSTEKIITKIIDSINTKAGKTIHYNNDVKKYKSEFSLCEYEFSFVDANYFFYPINDAKKILESIVTNNLTSSLIKSRAETLLKNVLKVKSIPNYIKILSNHLLPDNSLHNKISTSIIVYETMLSKNVSSLNNLSKDSADILYQLPYMNESEYLHAIEKINAYDIVVLLKSKQEIIYDILLHVNIPEKYYFEVVCSIASCNSSVHNYEVTTIQNYSSIVENEKISVEDALFLLVLNKYTTDTFVDYILSELISDDYINKDLMPEKFIFQLFHNLRALDRLVNIKGEYILNRIIKCATEYYHLEPTSLIYCYNRSENKIIKREFALLLSVSEFPNDFDITQLYFKYVNDDLIINNLCSNVFVSKELINKAYLLNANNKKLIKNIAGNKKTSTSIIKKIHANHKNEQSILLALAENETTPTEVLIELSKENNHRSLSKLASNKSSPIEILLKAYKLNKKEINLNLASNPATPPNILASLHSNADKNIKSNLAGNPNTPHNIYEILSNDRFIEVRTCLAMNPHVPLSILRKLLNDKKSDVRVSAEFSIEINQGKSSQEGNRAEAVHNSESD